MFLALFLGVIADYVLGEPIKWHPLVAFGKVATRIEQIFYPRDPNKMRLLGQKMFGVAATLFLICPCMLFTYVFLSSFKEIEVLLSAAVLYLCLGGKSLGQHARAVTDALERGDLSQARLSVSYIVSRDTAEMSEADISRAAIESVLENGNDAIFGTLFWFALCGAPGAVLYRLSNTLDAMWGYKTDRYLYFGWFAARLDDWLNWIPARLTALSYVLVGRSSTAWHCWRHQAKSWYSPNAGPVMSAGAGALELALGGPASYHGQLKYRPDLGLGTQPNRNDIERAISLVQKSLLLWMISLGFILVVCPIFVRLF
ncbi:adenosylcobinamide-phosphate synthase CbiB [soil metagenome]